MNNTSTPHTVIFIHGAGETAYEEDEPLAVSLQAALSGHYHVAYPHMPASFEATYDDWAAPIVTELSRVEGPVTFVGHSVGGSVLLKHLCDTPVERAAGLYVVAAPFWGADDFWSWDEAALPLDAAARLSYLPRLFLYHAVDDEVVPVAQLELYERLLPHAKLRKLDAGGHQLGNDLSLVAADMLAGLFADKGGVA